MPPSPLSLMTCSVCPPILAGSCSAPHGANVRLHKTVKKLSQVPHAWQQDHHHDFATGVMRVGCLKQYSNAHLFVRSSTWEKVTWLTLSMLICDTPLGSNSRRASDRNSSNVSKEMRLCVLSVVHQWRGTGKPGERRSGVWTTCHVQAQSYNVWQSGCSRQERTPTSEFLRVPRRSCLPKRE